MFSNFKEDLIQTFVTDDRYMYFVNGLGVTLIVAALALVLGLVIGFLIAVVRTAHDQQAPNHKNPVLGFFNVICKIYLTVIRGTPTMVQLLIMWFVVMASMTSTQSNLIRCAVLAFGINSGAYVAEILRSGLMSVDIGQMEAGRSLGLPYGITVRSIILPQAIKNVIPALGNEAITLLKETSIVTVIGLKDLTKGAMIIQGITYQAIVPFLAVAAIYLVLVMILSWLFGILERRMRVSDMR